MPTKLSRLCEGIMEAAWLAAVILVPLFFNIYSSRIFEPDKISILRSLALLILGAWIVKLVDEGGVRWEQFQSEGSKIKSILSFPLAAPVIGMTLLYLVATIFSVTPRVSFWGSYQRLQGTYTTLSYLIIFAAILTNLRKRAHVERLITAIVLSSLPVALYGVLQHYKIDPIPWGGDTSIRIAANMGNSIFVAAYLIMVFPVTIGRIVLSFRSILRDEVGIWVQVAQATVYVFIAALQLIAMYMSGSRGPALGWMAGSFFLFLLLSLHWNKRWMTIATVGVTGALAVFLVIFNIPDGPLAGLRNLPAIGRFGSLLDAESNSALVRKYIWEGAVKLVTPHEPIKYPDGHGDTFNILRPLIGYGPESMYVAYNPFYIPQLAIVEKRNASPDRSHNETWDSLVITGVLGIVVYLAIFMSVFYYGLKWIGLINSKRQSNLFLGLCLGIGIFGGGGFAAWRGVEYFGVGLPFGILIGFLLYLVAVALLASYQPPKTEGESLRSLTLIVIIAAIVSHFVEINFGIAIASTRTYFWVYSALLVVVGYVLPRFGEYEFVQTPVSTGTSIKQTKVIATRSTKKKRRSRFMARSQSNDGWSRAKEVFVPALIISFILASLGYDFITNPKGITSGWMVIWTSFTELPNQNITSSPGILALFLTSWIAMAVLYACEVKLRLPERSWWKSFGLILGISFILSMLYWLWHAASLATLAQQTVTDMAGVLAQVGRYEGLLTNFYLYGFLIVIGLAVVLSDEVTAKLSQITILGGISASIGIVLIVLASVYSNLRVIQADIAFKLADPFARSGQWPVAITIYDRANELAPNEDYYYLFLGRAYLEYGKTITDAGQRDSMIRQAEADLQTAQKINPLNTDHTANLARLYSLWASYSSDTTDRVQKGEISSNYFKDALDLSPNSARLWDEWALLYLNVLQKPDEAYQRLSHSLQVDPSYYFTYGLFGDYYGRTARQETDPQKKQNDLQDAVVNYTKAMSLPISGDPQAMFNYAVSLAGTQALLGNFEQSIQAYQQAVQVAPEGAEVWRVEEVLANLYAQLGDKTNALMHAQNALTQAPSDQKTRIQTLIDQLEQAQP